MRRRSEVAPPPPLLCPCADGEEARLEPEGAQGWRWNYPQGVMPADDMQWWMPGTPLELQEASEAALVDAAGSKCWARMAELDMQAADTSPRSVRRGDSGDDGGRAAADDKDDDDGDDVTEGLVTLPDEATFEARLLSGKTVLELTGSTLVGTARKAIASTLQADPSCIRLLGNATVLEDNQVALSEVLIGEGEQSLTVVVKDPNAARNTRKKAKDLIQLGQYRRAREMLVGIDEVSQARRLLEEEYARMASNSNIQREIEHELAQLVAPFSG